MHSHFDEISLADALSFVVDNRGRSAPIQDVGIPLIATNCISNDNLYPTKDRPRYVSQKIYNNWFRSHPQPGDIILTNKGSQNGAVCLVPDPVDFCIAQDMVALRANSKKIDPLYLFAALRSSVVQKRIKDLNVDAVIPHFKKTDFNKLFLPLPNRKQQEYIGRLYFSLSRKIELNSQINQILEQMAQTIFKSWFVDFEPAKAKIKAKDEGRDPERASMCVISGKNDAELDQLSPEQRQQLVVIAELFPDELEDSELGLIPQGWKIGTIADLCVINGKSWGTKTMPPQVHYVDLANTKNGEISDIQVFNAQEAPSRARRVLRPGDTIVGTVRPGNRSFALIGSVSPVLTGSTGFAVLTPKTEELRELVFMLATSDSNIERLTRLADGAAYPAVRPEVVVDEQCFIPSESLVGKFHQAVGPLFDQVLTSRKSCETLAALRDTLLPKLLSGEIEVNQVS